MNQIREEPRHSNCRSSLSFSLSCFLEKKKKKSDDLARDDGGGARASRQPRARDPTATQTRARVAAQTLLLLFVVQCYNSRRPIFFCVVVQRKFTQPIFTNNKATLFHSRALWRQKKRGRFLWPWTKVLSFALRRNKVLPPSTFGFFFSFFFFRTPRTTTFVLCCFRHFLDW